MKTMMLSGFAAMMLTSGVAYADTNAVAPFGAEPPAFSAAARLGQTSPAVQRFLADNPTALPSYELRPDGLMINGLLPAPGWQG
jgi:hypothetical protein